MHTRSPLPIRRVTDVDDPARDGFIDVYKEAFGGPPYNEDQPRDWVREHVWGLHVSHCLFVCEDTDGSVIGMSCALPVLAPGAEACGNFLSGCSGIPFDLRDAIYMSEVGVAVRARRRGLGTRLIRARIAWGLENDFGHFVMRTASAGSHSAGIYLRMGCTQLPHVQNVGGEDVASASSHRIYIFGPTSLAA